MYATDASRAPAWNACSSNSAASAGVGFIRLAAGKLVMRPTRDRSRPRSPRDRASVDRLLPKRESEDFQAGDRGGPVRRLRGICQRRRYIVPQNDPEGQTETPSAAAAHLAATRRGGVVQWPSTTRPPDHTPVG